MDGSVIFTPLAIIVSAVIGAVVALYATSHQWRIASMRSTLQYALEREVHDEYWTKMREKADAMLVDAGDDQQYWESKIRDRSEDLAALRIFLNHYELVAAGIKYKIIDEQLYADWARRVVTRNWDISKTFVAAVRDVTKREDTFLEFQNLAERWERELVADTGPKPDRSKPV